MPTETWRQLLHEALTAQNDAWTELVGTTLTQEELDAEFNNHGVADPGRPFTLWTKKRVYFCVHDCGRPGVKSVPRNPCDEAVDLCFE